MYNCMDFILCSIINGNAHILRYRDVFRRSIDWASTIFCLMMCSCKSCRTFIASRRSSISLAHTLQRCHVYCSVSRFTFMCNILWANFSSIQLIYDILDFTWTRPDVEVILDNFHRLRSAVKEKAIPHTGHVEYVAGETDVFPKGEMYKRFWRFETLCYILRNYCNHVFYFPWYEWDIQTWIQ
jgi:hypothetical protein